MTSAAKRARSAIGRAAVAIAAPVAAGPEELVDQVAVRAVNLERVEAERLGVGGRAGKGRHGVGDRLLAHRFADGLIRGVEPRRRVERARRKSGVARTNAASMPDLRPHLAARFVNGSDHPAPATERLLAVEQRDVRHVARRRTADDRAFGQDQPDPACRPPPVVFGVLRARHALGRHVARHRRHHDAVGQR